MLLAIPFSLNDHAAALSLARYLKLWGSYSNHEVLLVCPRNAVEQLAPIVEAVTPLFGCVHTHEAGRQADGWPAGPNTMFHATADYVYQNIDCKAFYFFEPDNTPVKEGWLDLIEVEYTNCGKPLMGSIQKSHVLKNGEPMDYGTHMVGTGVYPKDLPRVSKLFGAARVNPMPFDVFMQWELVPNAHHTKQILHQRRTSKYVSDKATGTIFATEKEDPYTEIEPITSLHSVVHGCRDESLRSIMRGKAGAKKAKELASDAG